MASVTFALDVLKELLPIMETHATEEVGLLWNFKDDLKEMERTLVMLEAVLEDAERQSIKTKVVSVWLAELRDACYDIQDMLDPYLLEFRRYRNGKIKKVFLRKMFTRIGLAHKMKDMRQRLNNIAERKNRYSLKENVGLDMSTIIKGRDTFSLLSNESIEGRDKERTEIVKLIQNNNDNDKTFVIPIYGIGGLGKTTLAKLIFNDSGLRDSKHFDAWAWAHVSLQFDLHNIGRRIIKCFKNSECNLQNLEEISKEMQREVSGKRCLIVLDDIWSITMEHWEDLKTMLKGSSKGSTILVTTRNERIAKDIATDHTPYSLNTLSDETCMLLFQQRAFVSNDEMKKYPKLLNIGKKIVMKCGGVALAANTLGSMLCSQRDEKDWLDVMNSELWEMTDNMLDTLSTGENKILSSLILSYHLMPRDLKPCFAYCSIFPKGHEIKKIKLIHHWISLDFIRSTPKTTHATGDIAERYLDRLISMSFLQRSEWRENVVMHDLMHDLSQIVAKDHDIKIVSDSKDYDNESSLNTMSYRYISFSGSKKSLKDPEIVKLNKKVRAIYCRSAKVMPSQNQYHN